MIVNPTAADPNHTRNRLLRLIPDDERAYVLSICDKVPLREQQVLHEYMVPIEHIYFIESGPSLSRRELVITILSRSGWLAPKAWWDPQRL